MEGEGALHSPRELVERSSVLSVNLLLLLYVLPFVEKQFLFWIESKSSLFINAKIQKQVNLKFNLLVYLSTSLLFSLISAAGRFFKLFDSFL